MRAITICQPYASLICNEPFLKRVENRTWPVSHRGNLAIHAGASKKWLSTMPSDEWPDPMPMSAVLGIAQLVDCIRYDEREAWADAAPGREWILEHPHASGPFCWILERVERFAEPIPCAGAQGIWQWTPPAEPVTLADGIPLHFVSR